MFFDPVKIIVYRSPTAAKQITYSGDPNDFILEFSLPKTYTQKDIPVSHLNFFKATQGQSKSSIIRGNLLLQEIGKNLLSELALKEGDRLEITPSSIFQFSDLSFSSEGIFMEGQGKLKTIYTFHGREKIQRNPTKIKWFWHNHRTSFIFFGLVALVFLFLITFQLWKEKG